MARKCTEKHDAHVKLLFCQSKPFASLPCSLPSPSSLLKLPNKSVQWYDKINVIDLLREHKYFTFKF